MAPQNTGVVKHAKQMRGALSPSDNPPVLILPPIAQYSEKSSSYF